jgi:hypothetical protein
LIRIELHWHFAMVLEAAELNNILAHV